MVEVKKQEILRKRVSDNYFRDYRDDCINEAFKEKPYKKYRKSLIERCPEARRVLK